MQMLLHSYQMSNWCGQMLAFFNANNSNVYELADTSATMFARGMRRINNAKKRRVPFEEKTPIRKKTRPAVQRSTHDQKIQALEAELAALKAAMSSQQTRAITQKQRQFIWNNVNSLCREDLREVYGMFAEAPRNSAGRVVCSIDRLSPSLQHRLLLVVQNGVDNLHAQATPSRPTSLSSTSTLTSTHTVCPSSPVPSRLPEFCSSLGQEFDSSDSDSDNDSD